MPLYQARLYLEDWRAWFACFVIRRLGGDARGGGTLKTIPRWGFYHRGGFDEECR